MNLCLGCSVALLPLVLSTAVMTNRQIRGSKISGAHHIFLEHHSELLMGYSGHY